MSAIHLQSTVIASMFVCGPVEFRLTAPRVSSYSASSFVLQRLEFHWLHLRVGRSQLVRKSSLVVMLARVGMHVSCAEELTAATARLNRCRHWQACRAHHAASCRPLFGTVGCAHGSAHLSVPFALLSWWRILSMAHDPDGRGRLSRQSLLLLGSREEPL